MKPTPADVVLILLAAVGIALLFAARWQPAAPAEAAEVRQGGTLVARYALHEPRVIEVQGRLGASTLAIADGAARFTAGPCRNKVCVHRGWVRRAGDAVACVPNRVSLSLVGGPAARFDAVSH